MYQVNKHYIQALAAVILIGAVCIVVFYRGLHGPFIFDDDANILSNYYLPIKYINFSSLYLAAISGHAGPLGRPLSMITFAINSYLSGGLQDTFGFKVTNLTIHMINGVLVLNLFRILLNRIRSNSESIHFENPERIVIFFTAFLFSLIWVIHPIQVTSVFYVVQRMATLSGFFVLLGLNTYLYARSSSNLAPRKRLILYCLLIPILIMGLLSKENAVLLLPFILVIELFFFKDGYIKSKILDWHPWSSFGLIAIFITGVIALVYYSLPGYETRNFTLIQRILTETRILVFYLGLIFVPVLNKFGLFHDDIILSTGLFSPPTTFFSIIFLVSLSWLTFSARKKYPHLLFGWLWFLIAHSIESTVIPLELAHEHRNYIALIGPLFAVAVLFINVFEKFNKQIVLISISLCIALLGILSFARTSDWASYDNLIVAESTYHPRSARAQAALGSLLVRHRLLSQGLSAMGNAYRLNPEEPGFLLNMVLIKTMMGKNIPQPWKLKLESMYEHKPISPLGMQVLDYAQECSRSSCSRVSRFLEILANKCAVNPKNSNIDRAGCRYYEALLANRRGDHKYAIKSFTSATNLDPNFLNPIMQIALVQLHDRNYTGARDNIQKLISRNRHIKLKKVDEINKLIQVYNNTITKSDLAPMKTLGPAR